MATLRQTLQDRDRGFLQIVAELWGLDLPTGALPEAAASLARAMLVREVVAEQLEALGPASRQALSFLISQGGRHPVADAERRFGPIRAMGPGRRDRDKPWIAPASPLEDLWYRGFLGRHFADTPAGPQEFFFIPSDLLSLLRATYAPTQAASAPALPTATPDWSRPASLAAADDATTLLAALRRRAAKKLPLEPSHGRPLARFLLQPGSTDLLLTLLLDTGLLTPAPHQPQPEAVRAFLDLTRSQAVRQLFRLWRASNAWNDLAHVHSLASPTGIWPNDPRLARTAILARLSRLAPETWWSLDSFIDALRDQQPDFQRPAGAFDSWYLQDRQSGMFLQGFEHWDRVEGALVRYLLCGPLHWLGLIDLGGTSGAELPTSFRLSLYAAWLLETAPDEVPVEPPLPQPVSVTPDGCIHVHRFAPLALRYQIARFTAWEAVDDHGWHHRLSPSALQAGTRQGLRLSQMRSLLESASNQPLPQAVNRALDRFEQRGCEARLEQVLLLRVSRPEVLQELRRSRTTARYLGEQLGPTTVRVRERDWDALRRAAARLGLLIDPAEEIRQP